MYSEDTRRIRYEEEGDAADGGKGGGSTQKIAGTKCMQRELVCTNVKHSLTSTLILP